MPYIPLTRGHRALVDDADYDWLAQWNWLFTSHYAGRFVGPRNDRRLVLMHRLLIEAPAGTDVDHINGNKLDNRRANLRLATRSQNMQNVPKQQGIYSSRYKGVYWFDRRRKWSSAIEARGRRYHIGYFDREIDAALAYDAKARELFGDFARTNF